jgi:hypothetical protein
MGSGAVIYVPSFIKIGSRVQNLIGGIRRHTDTDIMNSSHTNSIYRYLNCKRKLLHCNANMNVNKTCLKKNIILNFMGPETDFVFNDRATYMWLSV